MAEAAKMVEDLGYDAVDINLGCPAKKVVKCGGSGLLRDLPLLGEIFRAVRAAVKIPLTIKLRAGWDEKSVVAVEVAKWRKTLASKALPCIRGRASKVIPAQRTGASLRRQAGREDSRDWQWRHQPAGRCGRAWCAKPGATR